MLRLITDFDGPIIDVSDRYYQVYQYCLERVRFPQQEIYQLSKAEFWQLKRARVPQREIGKKSGLNETQAKEFAYLRRVTVHTLPYLKYDKLIPGATEALLKAQFFGFDLVVMTMRRDLELNAAFEQYDIAHFFPQNRRYCLHDEYEKTTDVHDKPKLMQQALEELPSAADVWMVGDTEADIVAAKTHRVKVIGVLSGIRDRHRLEQHQPDLIVNNLLEAVEAIAATVRVPIPPSA